MVGHGSSIYSMDDHTYGWGLEKLDSWLIVDLYNNIYLKKRLSLDNPLKFPLLISNRTQSGVKDLFASTVLPKIMLGWVHTSQSDHVFLLQHSVIVTKLQRLQKSKI